MRTVLAVAVGGALGSLLRYGFQKALNLSFPTGTLTANLLGCFVAGCLWAWAAKGLNAQAYLFLMTGFCGGFTTLSAFSVDSVQMMTTGRWPAFFLYTLASVGGGFLATFLGFKIFSS